MGFSCRVYEERFFDAVYAFRTTKFASGPRRIVDQCFIREKIRLSQDTLSPVRPPKSLLNLCAVASVPLSLVPDNSGDNGSSPLVPFVEKVL